MRHMILSAVLVLLAACAATGEVPEETQAIRDYIDVGELHEVDRIRTFGSDAWSPLTDYFAVYSARDGKFLLEFTRICREMTDNTHVTPDRRYDHNVMRRGIDTLRGCRIDRMYALTDAQVIELETLGKGPLAGN